MFWSTLFDQARPNFPNNFSLLVSVRKILKIAFMPPRVVYNFRDADFFAPAHQLYAKNFEVVMAKKMKTRLADDIRAGLDELRDLVAGKKTGVVVHYVIPSASRARNARRILGIQAKPKHRALKSKAS